MKKYYWNLLVRLKLKKPFKTYMGKPVTNFKYDFNVFMLEYREILKKRSNLTRSRRDFVQKQVEAWLKENKIPLTSFKKRLLE